MATFQHSNALLPSRTGIPGSPAEKFPTPLRKRFPPTGQFSKLDAMVCPCDSAYVLEDDAEVWALIGGIAGLIRMRQNAVQFLQFFQSNCPNCPPEDSFFSEQIFFINLYIIGAVLESVVRFLIPGLPHVSGHTVVRLRDEVELRARTMAEDLDLLEDAEVAL